MQKHLFVAVSFCFWLLSAHAADAPVAGTSQSPRLSALSAALDRKDPTALAVFWEEVEKVHTPLVEELPNQPHDALYTFLIRADPADDVLNVRLGADFPMRTEHHTDTFLRLGNSNVWYTSYVLPKASRIFYRIRVPQGLQRSPASPARFTIDGVLYEHFLDPLNPKVFPEGKDHVDAPGSYYVGSEAPRNPYLKVIPGVPGGSLEKFEIDSRVLSGKRTVTMYSPANYASKGKPLPLILQFDGESYIIDVAAPVMLDKMIAQKAIPPVVVAFLRSQGTRNDDLQPNGKFEEFIGTELVPWIRERYRVSKDAKQNVVSGSSLGGLAAAYTAYMHPEIFGNVLSQSGAFWWSPHYELEVLPSPNAGWMVKQFAESTAKPIRFYMSVGSWESAGMLSGNRILRSVLTGKGNEVTYSEVVSGHNYANFQQTFPDGLIALLGKMPH
ncbi:MAG: alpha/beta hydrolase [Steroidobacteraceae bacterium]